ncbi:MAG: hypothetical protein H6716_24000 [Polyangiaceae bacterium]|nr:hypothetical protein [Polyangiaceae bacterium]
MANSWLVMCDVDGVQAWLMRSVHLREIAGASQMLADFDDGLAKHARKGTVLFVGGGTALVGFEDEQPALDFCRAVPNALEQATVNATLSVSDPVLVGEGGFGAAMKKLVEDLERKKRVGQGRGEPLDFCHAVRCEGCALEPAVTAGTVKLGTDTRLLGAACLARHKARERTRWLDWMRGHCARWKNATPAADASALAGGANLALVLADVNGVGDRLAALGSVEAYKAFSKGLGAALREALVRSIAAEVPSEDLTKGSIPVEVLYAGGDDLLIACRGDLAMPLVSTLAAEFAARAGSDSTWTGGQPLGISFGVTITGGKFPFRVAHTIAAGLLRHAKRVARAEGWVEGAVDWAVVTETWGSSEAILADRVFETDSESLFLTGRPYRVSGQDARGLSSFRQACGDVAANFPRNKLYDLRRWCSAAQLRRDGADSPSEAKERLDDAILAFTRSVRRDPQTEYRWNTARSRLGLDESDYWAATTTSRTPLGDLADGLALWSPR